MRTFFTFLLAIVPLAIVQAAPSVSEERACAPPDVNAATVNLIKQFEGFVASPQNDPVGLPTVGYGHLCKSKNCAEVPFKFPLTQDDAAKLLQTDLKTFENCVSNDLKPTVKLNDNQYGALTSWAFNVGCGNVGSSDLVKRMNAGEDPTAVAQSELPQWNKGGGKVLPGLTRRRAAEVALFKTPSSVIAHPAC
ncbi:glycoside hydrolase family 24 protein [Macrolepiota fuliginosa MF-IS2]|uniref:Glycoside hydrolase family 24 protein n=1 Tax=Macrolepiota fuliginosa MF-IS2 TaxID=1400762 RepID=A0A9P6BZB9_9AGAR|nr:glycoside hydrolase family 24 protein [Macrolepiota fuliginosa MF-IS2]